MDGCFSRYIFLSILCLQGYDSWPLWIAYNDDVDGKESLGRVVAFGVVETRGTFAVR